MMSQNMWDADIDIDLQLVTSITSKFSDLKNCKLSIIGRGWDNIIVSTDSGMLLRFPTREIACPLILNELLILPIVEQYCSTQVPYPEIIGTPTKEFPYTWYGYKYIAGRAGEQVTLNEQAQLQLAKSLAEFINQLHSIPSDEFILPMVPFNRLDRKRLNKQLHLRLEKLIQIERATKKHHVLINKIAASAIEAVLPDKRSLVHGDLYFRHLIFDKVDQLAGIIDWGDSGISHPIVDYYIGLQMLSPMAQKVFFERLPCITRDELQYTVFLAIYSSITMMVYANDLSDDLLWNAAKTSYSNVLDSAGQYI